MREREQKITLLIDQATQKTKTAQNLQQQLDSRENEIERLKAQLTQQTNNLLEQTKNCQVLQQKLTERENSYQHLKQEHQKQISEQNSLDAIANTHLNKWRKHYFAN